MCIELDAELVHETREREARTHVTFGQSGRRAERQKPAPSHRTVFAPRVLRPHSGAPRRKLEGSRICAHRGGKGLGQVAMHDHKASLIEPLERMAGEE